MKKYQLALNDLLETLSNYQSNNHNVTPDDIIDIVSLLREEYDVEIPASLERKQVFDDGGCGHDQNENYYKD